MSESFVGTLKVHLAVMLRHDDVSDHLRSLAQDRHLASEVYLDAGVYVTRLLRSHPDPMQSIRFIRARRIRAALRVPLGCYDEHLRQGQPIPITTDPIANALRELLAVERRAALSRAPAPPTSPQGKAANPSATRPRQPARPMRTVLRSRLSDGHRAWQHDITLSCGHLVIAHVLPRNPETKQMYVPKMLRCPCCKPTTTGPAIEPPLR